MLPKSVLVSRKKQSLDRIRDNYPQTQRVATSGHQNPGSRGEAPALFLPISREKWGPSPGRRGNGALRPEASEQPQPPVGYVLPKIWPPAPPPGPPAAGPTPQKKRTPSLVGDQREDPQEESHALLLLFVCLPRESGAPGPVRGEGAYPRSRMTLM